MTGRGFVVTGGASGLGLATVERLAAAGGRVAIIDLNPRLLDQRVNELRSNGHEAHGFAGDVTPKAEALALFERAADRLGRVDGLINCAGVYPRRPILDISDEDWEFDWKVNVRGTYNMMVAAVEHMRAQPLTGKVRGRIVNVSSVDAFKAHPNNAHYAA